MVTQKNEQVKGVVGPEGGLSEQHVRDVSIWCVCVCSGDADHHKHELRQLVIKRTPAADANNDGRRQTTDDTPLTTAAKFAKTPVAECANK